MGWGDSLERIEAKGAHTRPGGLAGLAKARQAHMGQFFTPEPLARLLWRLVAPAMDAVAAERRRAREQEASRRFGSGFLPPSRVSILDTGFGNGRLFRQADPERHALYGCEVDERCVEAVSAAAEAAGFRFDFRHAGMEAVSAYDIDAALVNPGFGLTVDSPFLVPYSCNTHGPLGPRKRCLSQRYAVCQALTACSVVAAILPANEAEWLEAAPETRERLAAILEVPGQPFKDETGAGVSVLVAVFDSRKRSGPQRLSLSHLDSPVPDLNLAIPLREFGEPRLHVAGVEDSEPAITRPVTGDMAVRVTHDGRRIQLHFACGLTEAKVLNAVLIDRLHHDRSIRRPVGARYVGQGRLDVEAYLCARNPIAAFADLLRQIRGAGGRPRLDPGLKGYLRRRARETRRALVPFRQRRPASGRPETFTATAKATGPLGGNTWGAPVIEAGQDYVLSQTDQGFQVTVGDRVVELNEHEAEDRFALPAPKTDEWETTHPGKAAAYPELAHQWSKRIEALGLDAWLRDYQREDLVEMLCHPQGSFTAWDTALGKSRLPVALLLCLGVKYGLVVTEAGLVPELEGELEKLPVAADHWKVIDSASDLDGLRPINLISYERLRMPVDERRPKFTYAKALRRRCGTVICDEGGKLRHLDTAQTRAIWQLSPKRRYVLDGTPVANYPRDLLPIATWLAGDGTALQPYGYRRAAMSEALLRSMSHAERGIDVFKAQHCTFEWITNEFADRMSDAGGAKREVPKLADPVGYQEWHAPFLLRRRVQDPEVRRYFQTPEPTCRVETVSVDDAHLAYYLDVAEDFKAWFERAREDAARDGKNVSLVSLLARIGAVVQAENYPQASFAGYRRYPHRTAKERAAVDILARWVREGHQVVCYAKWPGLLERLRDQLEAEGVAAVAYHGQRAVRRRTKDLNSEFRSGQVPVLLASIGVAERGLNLPEASRVLFFNRDWSASTEYQAIRRLLRPDQTRDVEVVFLHGAGLVSEYQSQLVTWKADAAAVGIDGAQTELAGEDFEHLDTLLGRFCNDLAELCGVERQDLRETLQARSTARSGQLSMDL